MRTIGFTDLLRESVNVARVAAVERRWKSGNVNRYPEGRDENIISYTVAGCKSIADGEDREVCRFSAPGAVLISKGAPYVSRTETEGEEGHTICVRFALTDDAGEPLAFREPYRYWIGDPDGRLLSLFRAVLSAYLTPDGGPGIIKARLYELLSELCGRRVEQQVPPAMRAVLPAIHYLEQHPAEDVPVPDLAAMCFLSESYFRARFRAFTGVTPTEYRNRLRVARADEMLSSSLWTVDLVASALGFCDTSHFYRVYKKYTGKTPRNTK